MGRIRNWLKGGNRKQIVNEIYKSEIKNIDKEIIERCQSLFALLQQYPIANWHKRLAQMGAGIITGSGSLLTFYYILEEINYFPALPLISFGGSIFFLGLVFWAFDERNIEDIYLGIFKSIFKVVPKKIGNKKT